MREDESGCLGRDSTHAEVCNSCHGAHVADKPTRVVVALGHPVTWCLAGTGRRERRWICREFQMAEDLANDLTLRDDGNESQHSALTKRARAHLQGKHALQESRPCPIRVAPRRLLPVSPLLARCGDDAFAEMAVRRQAPPIAHQMDMGQGDQRRQLLQEFQRCEANARGAVRPWMGEGGDALTVGVLCQPLQGHGTAGGIADELFQRVPPVRWNRRVGVEGTAVDTGTPGPSEPRRLALRAKTRADTVYVLPGSCSEGDTVLDRRRHGTGELRCGVAQGIIPRGYGIIDAGLQVSQMAQRANDAPTDLLDHSGDGGVGRWLTREKAWLQTLVSAIEKHSLQEEQVKVHVEIERTAKALDKGDRARVDGGPLMTLCDRLVDVILPDGGANDGVDLGSEVLRRRHPVAQGDRHRDDPLAGGDPGNDLLDEMRRHLRHAAAGTRRTKPAPFATEGYQQLLLAGVTAQAEKAIGKDAAP